MLPSAAELVARFLRANGYTETLSSLIKEADLPLDVGSYAENSVTIEQILQEKKTFDLSLSFEKLGAEGGQTWSDPAPSTPAILSTLPTKSNILSAGVHELVLPGARAPKPCMAVTTADRRLNVVDPLDPSLKLLQSYANIQDSPMLDVIVLNSRYLLVAAMSGKLVLYNTETDTIIDERKDHSKYIVKISSFPDGDSMLIATAGWDSKIQLYKLIVNGGTPRLGEPIATLTLQSIPETVLFTEGPELSSPVLLVARRDSTFLYYYDIPSPRARDSEFTLRGRQNLAPHSNAWVAFTPSDVQLCPTAPSIAAVATSSTPHMKLLVVRLRVPPTRIVSNSARGAESEPMPNSEGCVPDLHDTAAPATQAAQARAELQIQDRDEAAIILNINTMAVQTAYSTPKLAWRPDGSGIYVSSDDGIVRGFEASTGKLMAKLDAHDPGSKIRCLWAGSLQTRDGERYDQDRSKEFLVTGGFDQKLILWTTA